MGDEEIILFSYEVSKNKKVKTPKGHVSMKRLRDFKKNSNSKDVIIFKYKIDDIKKQKQKKKK